MRNVLATGALIAATALVGLGPLASSAQAQSVTVNSFYIPGDGTAAGSGDARQMNIDAHITVKVGGTAVISNEYVESGQIQLLTSSAGTLSVFCTDAFHNLVDGSYTLTTLTNSSSYGDGDGHMLTTTQIGSIAELINNFNTDYSNPTATAGLTLAELSSGTQLAIWAVEYGPANVGSTSFLFHSDDSVLNNTSDGGSNAVANLVSYATAHPATATTVHELIPTNPTNNQAQSYVGGSGLPNGVSVPEPASFGLLGAGLLGLGLVRRRRG